MPEEVSPCASYSFSDFDFLRWQPPGTKSMTKNDFWQGSTYLPIAPALGNLFSSVPTFFHVIDLGQYPTGNPTVTSNDFLVDVCATLEIDQNSGSNVCLIIHLMHELLQCGLLTPKDLLSTMPRQQFLKKMFTDNHRKEVPDLVPMFVKAFALQNKVAVCEYNFDSQSDSFSSPVTLCHGADDIAVYTWDTNDKLTFNPPAYHEAFVDKIPDEGMAIVHLVCVDKKHYVAANPANAAWRRVKKPPAPAPSPPALDDLPAAAPLPPVPAAAPPAPAAASKKHKVKVSFKAYSYKKQTDKHGNDALDKEGKVKKKLVLDSAKPVVPGVFLELFGTELKDYLSHKYLAVTQGLQGTLLHKVLPFTAVEFDAEFGENYSMEHGVEVQSEYWQHGQVTLFIVITRRWAEYIHGGEENKQMFTFAHCFVSLYTRPIAPTTRSWSSTVSRHSLSSSTRLMQLK